jgi:hypothetical protein
VEVIGHVVNFLPQDLRDVAVRVAQKLKPKGQHHGIVPEGMKRGGQEPPAQLEVLILRRSRIDQLQIDQGQEAAPVPHQGQLVPSERGDHPPGDREDDFGAGRRIAPEPREERSLVHPQEDFLADILRILMGDALPAGIRVGERFKPGHRARIQLRKGRANGHRIHRFSLL